MMREREADIFGQKTAIFSRELILTKSSRACWAASRLNSLVATSSKGSIPPGKRSSKVKPVPSGPATGKFRETMSDGAYSRRRCSRATSRMRSGAARQGPEILPLPPRQPSEKPIFIFFSPPMISHGKIGFKKMPRLVSSQVGWLTSPLSSIRVTSEIQSEANLRKMAQFILNRPGAESNGAPVFPFHPGFFGGDRRTILPLAGRDFSRLYFSLSSRCPGFVIISPDRPASQPARFRSLS